MPQPRKRKVSVFDLVKALEKALEVKQRRNLRNFLPDIKAPVKNFDMGSAMKKLDLRIKTLSQTKNKLKFSDLLSEKTRDEIVFTFLPLLHLSNQGTITLKQDNSFDDIFINIGGDKNVD